MTTTPYSLSYTAPCFIIPYPTKVFPQPYTMIPCEPKYFLLNIGTIYPLQVIINEMEERTAGYNVGW